MTENAKLVPMPISNYEYAAHDLANMLPMIEGADFAGLKADIKEKGILEPIRLFEGRILDGRNRYKAAKEVGHAFTAKDFKDFVGTYADAEAFVISTNFHRRQMTNAQKHAVIQRMIEKYPDYSNRKIGALCNIAHATVGKVRDKLAEPDRKAKEEFDRITKTFDDWPDATRLNFVRHFERDIREMLGG